MASDDDDILNSGPGVDERVIQAHRYRAIAEAILPAIEVLNRQGADVPPTPKFLLMGHFVEIALKSALIRARSQDAMRAFSHDLCEAWRACVEDGWPIEKRPPAWVEKLGLLHSKPYALRYAEGLDGYVGPNVGVAVSGCVQLLRDLTPS